MIGASVDSRACRSWLGRLDAAIETAGEHAIRAAVKAAEAHAVATTLYQNRTGDLRSHTGSTADGLTGEVHADMPYAVYVEAIRPFMYEARKEGAKVLAYGLEFYVTQAIRA